MTRRLQFTAAVAALTLRQLPVFDSSIKISDYVHVLADGKGGFVV